jgi:hypothetical protein
MTSLFLGRVDTAGVPADEKVIRNTATPVYVDAPPAEMPSMPDTNQVETDPNPNLGMTPRQLGSMWVEGSHIRPVDNITDIQVESNQVVNRQVSTSGTAAGRELAGETHKNASYAVGIEAPFDLADPNHKMGNTYFVRNPRDVQATMGSVMQAPPGMDQPQQGNIAAYGKSAARDAAQANLYRDWWSSFQ